MKFSRGLEENLALHSNFTGSVLTPLQWAPRAGVTRGWSWDPLNAGEAWMLRWQKFNG